MKKTFAFIALLAATPLAADPGKINNVAVTSSGGLYTFSVTITHADTGWDHYIDAWRITDMDGNVLGVRKLAHPHVDEQPFTRSLSNVTIPSGVETVMIQAHDNTSGWGAEGREVKLP